MSAEPVSTNSKDSQGWTPLMLAIDAEMQGVVQNGEKAGFLTTKRLLELGADASLSSDSGSSFGSLIQEYNVAE